MVCSPSFYRRERSTIAPTSQPTKPSPSVHPSQCRVKRPIRRPIAAPINAPQPVNAVGSLENFFEESWFEFMNARKLPRFRGMAFFSVHEAGFVRDADRLTWPRPPFFISIFRTQIRSSTIPTSDSRRSLGMTRRASASAKTAGPPWKIEMWDDSGSASHIGRSLGNRIGADTSRTRSGVVIAIFPGEVATDKRWIGENGRSAARRCETGDATNIARKSAKEQRSVAIEIGTMTASIWEWAQSTAGWVVLADQ